MPDQRQVNSGVHICRTCLFGMFMRFVISRSSLIILLDSCPPSLTSGLDLLCFRMHVTFFFLPGLANCLDLSFFTCSLCLNKLLRNRCRPAPAFRTPSGYIRPRLKAQQPSVWQGAWVNSALAIERVHADVFFMMFAASRSEMP